MDMPAQWAWGLLHGILPPSTLDFIQTYVLHPSSPVQTLRRSIGASFAAVWPIIAVALDRIAQRVFNSPDIVLLLFILVLLLVTIQILNFTRRVVVSLTRFVFNLVFYAAIVGLAAFMYQRGLEASVRDGIIVGARLWGYAVGVKDVFMREWERYSEEEKMRVRPGTTGGRW